MKKKTAFFDTLILLMALIGYFSLYPFTQVDFLSDCLFSTLFVLALLCVFCLRRAALVDHNEALIQDTQQEDYLKHLPDLEF